MKGNREEGRGKMNKPKPIHVKKRTISGKWTTVYLDDIGPGHVDFEALQRVRMDRLREENPRFEHDTEVIRRLFGG